MIWKNLLSNLKGIFENHNKKEWLNPLIENLEKKMSEDKNLPFRLVQIMDKGFKIKIYGLFGFISFKHMPWKYDDSKYWVHVFKYMKDKTFYCKIYKFNKKPLLIIVNAEVLQFKKIILTKNMEYEGVIIKKTIYGVFIDLGYSFNWQCGSFVQLIHKSNIDIEVFSELECGNLFKIVYNGDTGEQIVYDRDKNKINSEELIGKSVTVEIKKYFNNQTIYLIEGKYIGTIPVKKELYPNRKKYIRKCIYSLREGDTIHCEVVNITAKKQIIELKWINESEIEKAFNRNHIDENFNANNTL